MAECWKCQHEIEIGSKLSFRAVCPHCGIDLHVCNNCRYYAPGKPNDCSVPGTEFVRDREAANFCEDFSIKKITGTNSDDPLKKAKKIFGEDLPIKKNPFLE
jgi:predicted RNA-binding Zn-ribbon protein involved in translation (DUF1610 family)